MNYSVDLHVHTPASSDYKGEKDENEIVRVLDKAHKNGLDMICFTDHFSVDSYRQYNEKLESTKQLIDQLKARTSTVTQTFSEELNDELRMMTQVKVLMGIEVNISSGVHYTLVFSEKVTPDEVENFMFTKLSKELKGSIGSANYLLNMTDLTFFETVKSHFGVDVIICAPHIDSDNGLLTVHSGELLKRILQSQHLQCLGFNRLHTRDEVKRSHKSHYKAKRKRVPLHFIQCSDYHGQDSIDIGALRFHYKSDNVVCFDSLLERLSDNLQIQTSLDTIQEDYELTVKNRPVFKFLYPKDHELSLKSNDLITCVCAILNTGEGILEFSGDFVETDDNKITLDLKNFMRNFLETHKFRANKMKLKRFPISKRNYKVCIELSESPRLNLYEDKCYILDENMSVTIADSSTIECLVLKKAHTFLNRPTEHEISKITQSANLVKNKFYTYALFYKIEGKLKNRKLKMPSLVEATEIDVIEKLTGDFENGSHEGNLAVISSLNRIMNGRYEDSYARLSIPLYNITDTILNESIKKTKVENSLIIAFDDQVHFIEGSVEIVAAQPVVILEFEEKLSITDYKLQLLLMKSTVHLWYLLKIKGIESSFARCVRDGKVLSLCDVKDSIRSKLSSLYDQIVESEMIFIKAFNKSKADKAKKLVENDEYYRLQLNLVETHNNLCNNFMSQVDELIFEHLNILPEEQELIKSELVSQDKYIYGKKKTG